jgi:AGCS family alanine or glycine:cation symporter
LFGAGKKRIRLYQILFCSFIIIGSAMDIKSVIDFTDATYLVMGCANLIAVLIMLKDIKADLIDYCKRHNLIFKMNKVWFKDEQ